MSQPRKQIRKKETKIEGLDYCDDCFMFNNGVCESSDVKLPRKKNVKVPDWCGNKKNKEKYVSPTTTTVRVDAASTILAPSPTDFDTVDFNEE